MLYPIFWQKKKKEKYILKCCLLLFEFCRLTLKVLNKIVADDILNVFHYFFWENKTFGISYDSYYMISHEIPSLISFFFFLFAMASLIFSEKKQQKKTTKCCLL